MTTDSGGRFVCGDPSGDFTFAGVEQVLDAVEAGLVTADTPLFDAARQSWQPLARHPEIRAAWQERARYRPPGSEPLALPELPATELPPAADEEAEQRRRAYALLRGRERAGFLSVESSRRRRPRVTFAGLVWALLILAGVAWAIVAFAARLYSVGAGGPAATAGPPGAR